MPLIDFVFNKSDKIKNCFAEELYQAIKDKTNFLIKENDWHNNIIL